MSEREKVVGGRIRGFFLKDEVDCVVAPDGAVRATLPGEHCPHRVHARYFSEIGAVRYTVPDLLKGMDAGGEALLKLLLHLNMEVPIVRFHRDNGDGEIGAECFVILHDGKIEYDQHCQAMGAVLTMADICFKVAGWAVLTEAPADEAIQRLRAEIESRAAKRRHSERETSGNPDERGRFSKSLARTAGS